MMKRLVIFLSVISCIFTTKLAAQADVYIPPGTSVTLDGHWSAGEWDDAVRVSMPVPNSAKTMYVKLKHHQDTLLISFAGPLESANTLVPELMIDPDYDHGTKWNPEDSWFHVSATDCHYFGIPQVFNQCQSDHPEWSAFPNMPYGSSPVDTIEIRIPYSFVGLTAGVPHTFGLALSITNTVNLFSFWPSGVVVGQPQTWGTAVLVPEYPVGVSSSAPVPVQVYPNPASEVLQIDLPSTLESVEIQLINVMGQTVATWQGLSNTTTLPVSHLPGGWYQLVAHHGDGIWVQTIQIQ